MDYLSGGALVKPRMHASADRVSYSASFSARTNRRVSSWDYRSLVYGEVSG